MLPAPLVFIAGGALGLIARPAIEERREKKRKEEAERLAIAIAAALKNHGQ